jgi:hypothetical protein
MPRTASTDSVVFKGGRPSAEAGEGRAATSRPEQTGQRGRSMNPGRIPNHVPILPYFCNVVFASPWCSCRCTTVSGAPSSRSSLAALLLCDGMHEYLCGECLARPALARARIPLAGLPNRVCHSDWKPSQCALRTLPRLNLVRDERILSGLDYFRFHVPPLHLHDRRGLAEVF